MKRTLLIVLLALACGGPDEYDPPQLGDRAVPGEVGSLLGLLGVAPGTSVSWSIVEDGCGVIDLAGFYMAPSCPNPGDPSPFPMTCHVNATFDGTTKSVNIVIDEKVLGVTVSPPSVTLEPGQTQQFVATVTTSCGIYSSALAVTAPPAP